MSSTNPPANNSRPEMSAADLMDRGEQFTRIFVQPMVAAVRTEMKAHIDDVKKALDTVNGFEGRVSKLEKDQRKALLGWSFYTSIAAAVMAWSWNWIKGHIKVG